MKLSKEELRSIIDSDHVQCGDAAAMARELLERRERDGQEPVGYIVQDKYERQNDQPGHLSLSHVSKYVSDEDISEHEISCTPLFAAPPAPVVQEEMPPTNLFVQGVIDDGENCAYANDDEAHYFTVYRRNADGTADALMDFTNRVNALWAISLVKKLNNLPGSNS